MPNDFLNIDLLKRIGGPNQENDPFYKDPNKPYRPMDEIPRPSSQEPFDSTMSNKFKSPEVLNQIGTQPKISSIPGMEDPDDIGAMIDKLYPQDHAMADKFTAVWDQMPTREKPGKLKRILAAIANTGNPGTADDVLYGDYNRQMDDWTTKLKTLQPMLNDERYQNTNNRMIGSSVISGRNAENRTRIAQGELDRKTIEGQQRDEIARKKLELEKFKLDNPDYELEKDFATGRVMAVNPKKPGEKPIDTGLTYDNFSELDKAKWRIKEAAVPRTVNTTSTTTTIDPGKDKESPNDEKTRRYNAAQEAYNRNPEWQGFIKLGDPGTNSFTISSDAPPELVDFIYKGSKDTELNPPDPNVKISTSDRSSVSSKGIPEAPKIAPKINNKGIPPPIAQRTKGMKFTFPNGNVGEWDGNSWNIVSLKTK